MTHILEKKEDKDLESRSRREFLKTIGKAGIFIGGIGFSGWACKSGSTTPEPPKPDVYYNVTVINESIFSNRGIGGDVILNGERKTSGSTFSVKNGIITTLDVDNVSGYIKAYIVGRNSIGDVIYTRDKEGPHETTVNNHITIHTRLIPNNFDTKLLAKTVGDNVAPPGALDSMGNGVVQNYNKQTIQVGIFPDEAQPVPNTYEIVKECIRQINNGAKNPDLGQIIYLDYVGDLTQELDDGCTAKVREYGGGHHETLNGNVITKSYASISVHAPGKGMFIEELFQATTGSRWDAGVERCPYISYIFPFNFHNDAERAIQLANLLPPGFKLSTEEIPNVVIQENPFPANEPDNPYDESFILSPFKKKDKNKRDYYKQR